MVLKGIKVVEFAGLAPSPFCGMVLADFGASVLRVDKLGANSAQDVLAHGKQSIAIDLKNKKGVNIVKEICRNTDVLIEPFRPGVMEKLGLGPKDLMKENSRLIYARLTGFGQDGAYHKRAGHDINFVAVSGLLSLFGRANEKPLPPINLAADFAGGGLICGLGILLALFERTKSGLGQVIDANMVEGTAYLGSWMYKSQNLPIGWGKERGHNLLDSGVHFYEVYETKDKQFMSVGALEPQFYDRLLEGLELSYETVPQFENFEEGKQIFTAKFLSKTQKEWCKVFDHIDACVSPILTLKETPHHEHNLTQESFLKVNNEYAPKPAPRLERTPGVSKFTEKLPEAGEHTESVLKTLGYSQNEIDDLENDGVIAIHRLSKL